MKNKINLKLYLIDFKCTMIMFLLGSKLVNLIREHTNQTNATGSQASLTQLGQNGVLACVLPKCVHIILVGILSNAHEQWPMLG